MSGALDLAACPYAGRRSAFTMCGRHCGRCAKCGMPKHCSLHGPYYGQPPGSQPFDHEYVAVPEPKRRRVRRYQLADLSSPASAPAAPTPLP